MCWKHRVLNPEIRLLYRNTAVYDYKSQKDNFWDENACSLYRSGFGNEMGFNIGSKEKESWMRVVDRELDESLIQLSCIVPGDAEDLDHSAGVTRLI